MKNKLFDLFTGTKTEKNQSRFFALKNDVVENIYDNLYAYDFSYGQAASKCYVDMGGVIEEDNVDALLVLVEIMASKLRNDAEFFYGDLEDLERIFKLQKSLNIQEELSISEREYLEHDVKILETYYNKFKDAITKDNLIKPSDVIDAPIPKMSCEEVLHKEDQEQHLDNISEDSSFELEYLINVEFYNEMYKEKNSPREAMDKCYVRFNKYIKSLSIQSALAMTLIIRLLVKFGEEVKESELTDMYTAFTIYNSVNAKKILEKDRFELLKEDVEMMQEKEKFSEFLVLGQLKFIKPIPREYEKVFKTLMVNSKNEINGKLAYDRFADPTFVNLNEIALKIGDNYGASGNIKIHVELYPCPSCQYVIKQFQERYKNIKLEVVYGKIS